jgi:hypothetical protein
MMRNILIKTAISNDYVFVPIVKELRNVTNLSSGMDTRGIVDKHVCMNEFAVNMDRLKTLRALENVNIGKHRKVNLAERVLDEIISKNGMSPMAGGLFSGFDDDDFK